MLPSSKIEQIEEVFAFSLFPGKENVHLGLTLTIGESNDLEIFIFPVGKCTTLGHKGEIQRLTIVAEKGAVNGMTRMKR